MDRVGHVELGRQQRIELMDVLAITHNAFTVGNVEITGHFINLRVKTHILHTYIHTYIYIVYRRNTEHQIQILLCM